MEKKKLTDKAFEYFCERCKAWIAFFGVYDWRIDYEFAHEEDNSYRATVTYDPSGRVAVITLYSIWANSIPESVSHDTLDCTAFHEILELMCADMWSAVHQRSYAPEDEAQITYKKGVHTLIRRLEKRVLPAITRFTDVTLSYSQEVLCE